jgi:hypothetical protein
VTEGYCGARAEKGVSRRMRTEKTAMPSNGSIWGLVIRCLRMGRTQGEAGIRRIDKSYKNCYVHVVASSIAAHVKEGASPSADAT